MSLVPTVAQVIVRWLTQRERHRDPEVGARMEENFQVWKPGAVIVVIATTEAEIADVRARVRRAWGGSGAGRGTQ